MPTVDSTISTLERIRIKVRRLTRSPSQAQITDDEIDLYVNSFVLYDFPAHVTLSALMTTLTFYAKPNIDTYATTLTDDTDPLYNFSNLYTGVYGPAYIAGNKAFFTKSRESFYNEYPLTNMVSSINTGDGVTTNFTGTLDDIPVLQNNVLFSSVDTNNDPLTLIDVPTGTATGNIIEANDTGTVLGTINYITGVYDITFPVAPLADQDIDSQTVPYIKGKPSALLYSDNEFVIRPVPDQPYRVTVEAQIRPDALLAGASVPEMSRWWEYIALGTAKKVFEDRMDMDSVSMIMPEFKKQELLVLRPTHLNQSSERVATIFTERNRRLVNGI